MVNNMRLWAILAFIPLLSFVYSSFFKKFRYLAFSVGLIVYLGTIAFLRRYKSLQGSLVSQQTCDTQNIKAVSDFRQCWFMIKDTIDIAIKATKRADCLRDVAKWNIKNVPWRLEECNYINALYNSGVIERNQSLQEYERKTAN